mmetsp:Transcript_69001/g.156066  ORF Transcript_69001/g.156066 Transcript_69001/m.156066 type:complete len:441 (+) Transcript_69001:164-1486(+)
MLRVLVLVFLLASRSDAALPSPPAHGLAAQRTGRGLAVIDGVLDEGRACNRVGERVCERKSKSRRLSKRADGGARVSSIGALKGGAARSPRLLFLVTYVGYIAIYFARKPLSVVKPVLEEELGLRRESLGLVDTALMAAYSAGQLLLPKLGAVLTPRQLVAGGFLVSGLGTALVALCATPLGMSAASALAGFAAAPVNPLLVLAISDAFPAPQRASIVGLWQTSAQVGGIAANNGASLVLARGLGWRGVFACSGLIVGLFAPVMLAALKPAAPSSPATTGGATEAKSKAAGPGSLEVLRLPGVLSAALSYALVKCARYTLMNWLPLFFRSQVGLRAAQAGSVASLFDLGGVLGGVSAGMVTDTLLGGRMCATSALMAALCSLCFGAWALIASAASKAASKAAAGATAGGAPVGVALNVAACALTGLFIAGPDGILGGVGP